MTLSHIKSSIVFLGLFSLVSPAVGDSFSDCLNGLRHEASSQGISTATLRGALTDLRPDPQVIKLDRHQPERILSLGEYLQRVLPETRVQEGRKQLARHAEMLQRISKRFDVEAELLVALWGIETDYGRVLGRFDVTRSLTTLACDTRRPAFFRGELMHHLHLLDKDLLQHDSLKGSWAGAFGHLQFLPSVLRRYGIDRDNDGRIDLFTPSEDLFATAAKYLRVSGWRAGKPWGVELQPPYPRCVTERRCPDSPQIFLAQADLPVELENRLRIADGPLRVIHGSGTQARHFLVTGNFEALLKWNRSDKYAVAVGLLMGRLKETSRR